MGLSRAREASAYGHPVGESSKLRSGWLVVAAIAGLSGAGIFVFSMQEQATSTIYRAPSPAVATGALPTVSAAVQSMPASPTAMPSLTPPSRTSVPPSPLAGASPAPVAATAPAPDPAVTVAPQPAPAPIAPAAPASIPTFTECPSTGQVQMRLTSLAVVPSPLQINGAVGLDFSGVFENASDVPVYVERSELFAYAGEKPQPGLASGITFYDGGLVPAHGALVFKLRTMVQGGGYSPGGANWQVAGNAGNVLYSPRDRNVSGYCGPVFVGKALPG